MNDKDKITLLGKFEKIKGYSSELFDSEEWREFDAFVIGYRLGQLNSNNI